MGAMPPVWQELVDLLLRMGRDAPHRASLQRDSSCAPRRWGEYCSQSGCYQFPCDHREQIGSTCPTAQGYDGRPFSKDSWAALHLHECRATASTPEGWVRISPDVHDSARMACTPSRCVPPRTTAGSASERRRPIPMGCTRLEEITTCMRPAPVGCDLRMGVKNIVDHIAVRLQGTTKVRQEFHGATRARLYDIRPPPAPAGAPYTSSSSRDGSSLSSSSADLAPKWLFHPPEDTRSGAPRASTRHTAESDSVPSGRSNRPRWK